MKKMLAVALLGLTAISGTAFGQNVITTSTGNRWEGFYGGLNLGGVWNTTCNTWSASDSLLGPTGQNILSQRECPNGGAFVGGVQIGYNFQIEQWVWGFGLDYDHVSSKTNSHTYTVPAIPGTGVNGGTLVTNSKTDSTGIILLGPRVGYDFDGWLPFVRAGGVFQSGSPTGSATYTDNVTGNVVSFDGGKNAKNSGFGVGAGVEWMAQDPWSFKLEYTYISLGKSNSSTAYCSSNTANGCNIFNNVNIENLHNKLTASMVRLAVNYKFWSP